MKNILITGITGQDGKFLTKKLLENHIDIKIYGTTRDIKYAEKFKSEMSKIGVSNFQNIKILQVALDSKKDVDLLIKDSSPDLLFNLAGPSSVYTSIVDSGETKNKIVRIFDNLTEALIQNDNYCNFFQSSSSEMFAKNLDFPFDEKSFLSPNSPYGEAKLYCHNQATELNKIYDWKIVSGIMFNHESGFRSNDFLIPKIILNAAKNQSGQYEKLELGTLDYTRDWIHAEDMIEAIYSITVDPKNDTYVLGSGKGYSIRNLAEIIFSYFDLNFEDYVETNHNLLRDGDVSNIISNPKKLIKDYSWSPKYDFKEMLIKIIEFKLSQLK